MLHCGPTLKGEFCRSVTVTDVHTGWTEIDSDSGGECINDALIAGPATATWSCGC